MSGISQLLVSKKHNNDKAKDIVMNRRLSISVFSAILAMWATPVLAEEALTAAP